MSERKKKKTRNWWRGNTILYFLKDPEEGGYIAHQVYMGDSGAIDDLPLFYLPEDERVISGIYSRQQVKQMARLAGYDDEQIEAALLLADVYDASDEYDLCRISDTEYERLITNAKRRLAYWRKKAQKSCNVGGSTG